MNSYPNSFDKENVKQCAARFGVENSQYWFAFCIFSTLCPLIFGILAYITAVNMDERPRTLDDTNNRRYESVTCKYHKKSCYERNGFPFYQRTMTKKHPHRAGSTKECCNTNTPVSTSLRSKASREGAKTPIQESADRRSYVINSSVLKSRSSSSISV